MLRLSVRGLLVRKRWNPQHLAWMDLVGIGQQRHVGFKNPMISAAMAGAIFGLRDLPERIAGPHGIKLRLRRFIGGRGIVVDGGGANRIAGRRRDLRGLLRRGGAAREDDFVRLGFGLDVRPIETMLFGLLLPLRGGSGGGLGRAKTFSRRPI